MKTIFDIETTRLPDEELEKLIPPFDPSEVKLGNIKDQAKIDAKLADAASNWRANFIEKAALNPLTARLKMAGFYDWEYETSKVYVHEPDAKIFGILSKAAEELNIELICRRDEAQLIASLVTEMDNAKDPESDLIGYYCHQFDIPFMVRRAWINGVPFSTRSLRRGRYFRENIIDLYEVWGMGEKFPSTGGLNGLAKTLGVPTKTGDGKQFGELYTSDPVAALEYLIGDLQCTAGCAERMGVI